MHRARSRPRNSRPAKASTARWETATGKWQLQVAAEHPILVASLLRSPTGHLANLSSVPDNQVRRGTETVHRIPLFLSAAEAGQREGFARIINRGSEEATVRILAWDDVGTRGNTASLTVAAGSVAHFNSTDLEFGNGAKGLSGGIGRGNGHWRLELATEADLDVLTYVRTARRIRHQHARHRANRPPVATKCPSSTLARIAPRSACCASSIPATDQAWVSITGIDDAGNHSGNDAVAVPPGQALAFSADALENGEGVEGRLGDGTGKWRLMVTARTPDQPVQVMSLLESPTGHLTNLSTGQ